MPIEVIEISSSDEDGEEEYEEKVKTKVIANRSTWGISSGAKQYSGWRSRKIQLVGAEDEEEEDEYEDDDDCFVLPYDPFLGEQLDLSRRLTLDSPPLSDDVAIIAERGKVFIRSLVEIIPIRGTCVEIIPSARHPTKATAKSAIAMFVTNLLLATVGKSTAKHQTGIFHGVT